MNPTQMDLRAKERKNALQQFFLNIIRRETLSCETSTHTTEILPIKRTLREIHNTDEKQWTINTDSHISVQSIKFK